MSPFLSTLKTAALGTVVFGISALATAQTATPSPTREQVRKEAIEANKAGKIEHGEADHDAGRPPAKPAKSAVTRAEVRSETKAAVKAGKIEHGEADHDAGRPPAKPAKSAVSRAEVRKEAASAVRSGMTEQGEASLPQKRDEGALPKKK